MKLSTRLTVAMVALVMLTTTAVGVLNYYNIVASALPRALDRIGTHARVVATVLEASVRGARFDVSTRGRAIEGLVRATTAGGIDPADNTTVVQWRDRIAARFVAELNAKPTYTQFRIIGIADGGREIVRVDRMGQGGMIRIASQAELQRKGDRPYFQEAIKLAAGEVYASPVDFNQEGGILETPHVPTVRLAAPIFAPDGNVFGMMIINVDMRPAFAHVRETAPAETSIYLVNEHGDYIVHPDASREFGFEFGTPFRVQDDFPAITEMLAKDGGPGRFIEDRNGARFGAGMEPVRLAGTRRLSLIETVPHVQVMAAFGAVRNSSLLGGLAAVLCATALAVLIARSLTKPLVQMTAAVEGFAREEPIAIPTNATGEIGVLASAFARMGAEVREKTEALKREIEERSRIFETSPDLILVTDNQGTFTRVSPSSKAILGYEPDEMIGRNGIVYIYSDDLVPTRNEMRIARRGREMRNFETRYVHRDGRIVTLAWSGVWSEPEQRHFFIGRDMTEQKLAEEKFRLAVEASPSGLVMIDESGSIVLINAETERLFGYERHELIGQPVDMLVPARLRGHHVQHRSGFAIRPETRRMGASRDLHGLRKDGTEFPVEIGLNPIRTPAGLLVMSVIVDITESQKAQLALKQESDERKHVAEVLHNTITSMVDPVLVADANGKVLIVNPPAQKIFGRLSGVDTDRYALSYERFYPDGVTPFPFEQTPLFRAVRGESVDDLEFIVRPVGAASGFHLVASGRPLRNEAGVLQGAVTIYRDVTAKKKAQEALNESERMARGIIANSLDAIVQINEKGEVIEWNPQAEVIFGWSRAEAMGQPITSLYLQKGNRRRYLEMNEQLRNADGILGDRFEFEAVRKDGRKIKAEVSMTGARRRDGNIFNLFLRDITEKLAAEEQLRQSQKMEAVGQLTGGIAHDFNNMLTVITGTIDILADAVTDKPQLAAITKLIGEAADRGAELTRHLLAFSRKQPLQPRETNINALLVDATKLFRPLLGEHIEIVSALEDNAWPALVDPTQLTTALLNLAVNARDAMPDGGKLTLESDNAFLDQHYASANSEVQPGNYVMIAVSDTGTGIPAAIRDKIFEPFFSTKEVGKGTGLGLSMVYGFVKQSGGHIKVYSEEGQGTAIKIYLRQAGAKPEQIGDELSAPRIERGNETILIVEDDALVRTSVTTQLAGLGYRTISVANAVEALKVIDGGAAFDLLFTDVIMPGMNGRQLADEVARRRPGVKVLFTSGYTENAIIHHGRLDPGVLLLAKPHRKADLARMIRQALASAGVEPAVQPEMRAVTAI